MTNDNNTRKKANAVFFSVIMVLSMVAIGFAGFAGTAAANDDAVEPDDYDRDLTDIDAGAVPTVYQGQMILVDVTDFSEEETELRRVDTSGENDRVGGLVSAPTFLESNTRAILDTENRNADRYVLTDAGSGTQIDQTDEDNEFFQFEVAVQDLDVEFDDDEVGDTAVDSDTSVEIESDIRNRYVTNVSADGLDAEDLEDIFTGAEDSTWDADDEDQVLDSLPDRSDVHEERGDTQYYLDDDDDVIVLFNSEGDHELNFTDISTGDYEFEFEVFDSTAEDTDDITVIEGDEGEIDFAEDTIDTQQGAVQNITLEASDGADAAQLVIGDEDDIGYQLNATIDFDGDENVTVAFNTYLAGAQDFGEAEGDVLEIVSDGDAEFDNVEENTIENLLDTGDYQLAVKAGSGQDADAYEDTLDDPDNLGSLFIEERETNNWNTWISPSDADIEDRDDVMAGLEAGNITQSDTVAHEDLLIHQIDGTGLDGIFKAAEDVDGEVDADNPTDALVQLTSASHFDNEDGDTNFDLRIRETRDSAGPNAERLRIDVEQSGVEVVVGEDSDVFIVMDTDSDSIEFENDAEAELDPEDDYEFEVRFRNQDYRLLEFEGDEDDDDLEDVREQLDADFEIEEAFYDFDEDPYNVTASDDVVFMGETNAAPGSEHTARIRSTGDTSPRFNINEDFSVDADQNWASEEFDLSETSVGDTFTLQLRNTIVVDDDDAEVDGNIVEMEEEETETPEETPEETEEPETEEPETEEPETEEPETEEPETEEPTDDDTPGFGAVVALVALIAAALLATRRRP